MEDNALILKTLIQRAASVKQPLYTMFIDLEKAYDRIPRERLWNILLDELQLD